MYKPNLNSATFLKSVAKISDLPQESAGELAFVGCSNSGKSSAINTITNIKNLARTSKTPGRTQLINFFSLQEELFIVDLPGYGFAKVEKKVKQSWAKLLTDYISKRQSLNGIILIMDIRHPLKDFDWQMLELANHQNLPTHILLTKADKLRRGAASNALLKVKRQLLENHCPASIQLFSSLNKSGVDTAREKTVELLTNNLQSPEYQ